MLFTFYFLFKGKAHKEYNTSEITEEDPDCPEKGQEQTPSEGNFSYEDDQLHLQKFCDQNYSPSWKYHQAQARRDTG